MKKNKLNKSREVHNMLIEDYESSYKYRNIAKTLIRKSPIFIIDFIFVAVMFFWDFFLHENNISNFWTAIGIIGAIILELLSLANVLSHLNNFRSDKIKLFSFRSENQKKEYYVNIPPSYFWLSWLVFINFLNFVSVLVFLDKVTEVYKLEDFWIHCIAFIFTGISLPIIARSVFLLIKKYGFDQKIKLFFNENDLFKYKSLIEEMSFRENYLCLENETINIESSRDIFLIVFLKDNELIRKNKMIVNNKILNFYIKAWYEFFEDKKTMNKDKVLYLYRYVFYDFFNLDAENMKFKFRTKNN